MMRCLGSQSRALAQARVGHSGGLSRIGSHGSGSRAAAAMAAGALPAATAMHRAWREQQLPAMAVQRAIKVHRCVAAMARMLPRQMPRQQMHNHLQMLSTMAAQQRVTEAATAAVVRVGAVGARAARLRSQTSWRAGALCRWGQQRSSSFSGAGSACCCTLGALPRCAPCCHARATCSVSTASSCLLRTSCRFMTLHAVPSLYAAISFSRARMLLYAGAGCGAQCQYCAARHHAHSHQTFAGAQRDARQ